MLKKIKFALAVIWFSFVSFISPTWIGDMYMHITGNGKGYGYNMGAEADVSVMIGIFMLIIWIVSMLPVIIWLCKKCYDFKKVLAVIPIANLLILKY